MITKKCNHCGTEHPLTSEYWYSLNTTPQCKVYKRNQRKKKEQCSQWRQSRKEAHQKWKDNNRERFRQLARDSYYRNREKVIQRNYEYTKKRRQVDINYNLTILLRQRLNSALKGNTKTGSAVSDLGCTIEELRLHLESKFENGMTWDNHGRHGWHIDHIKPLSSFDLSDPEQLKLAVHYTNLQPLWAVDNLRKSNKEN